MFEFPALFKAEFVKRYKRFFTDVIKDGETITVHNPNTGSMKNLLTEGNPVLCSVSDNPARKLSCTLEAMCVNGEWLVVNTMVVNRIAESAINEGEIEELGSVSLCRREYSYDEARLDFYVESDKGKFLIEVKNCTLYDEHTVMFPDAVTTRGKKHLEVLQKAVREGYNACMLYMCQVKRSAFRPAHEIDPAYAAEFEKAKSSGVQILVYYTDFDPEKGTVSLKKMV